MLLVTARLADAASTRPLQVHTLGRMAYGDGLDLQKRLAALRIADEVPDQLLLLEHDPVITWSRTGRGSEHLLASSDRLAVLGVGTHLTDRGGDITYHGPGQVVGYPILKLVDGERDLHRYLRRLEEFLIQFLKGFGLEGVRSPGETGVWVEGAKVAAIGIRASRWVTHHGFALNVDPDMSHFGLIVPCGLHGRPVTSLRQLGVTARPEDVLDRLVDSFTSVFGRERVPGALA